MRRPLRLLAGTLLVVALALSSGEMASAQELPRFSVLAESRFPEGLHFDVSVDWREEIVEARVRFWVLGEQASRYAPLEIEPGREVRTGLLVRTDTAQRYIPPGAEIEFSVEATDATGAVMESDHRRIIFLDPRFAWTRLDAPAAYIHYYGGQEGRARRALEAAQEALERMGSLMGVPERDTLRLTVYNSVTAMREALPPRSAVQEETLVTEGVSFCDTGVVLLLGGNPELEGVAVHETVHFLMRFAVGGGARTVPAWLNEGLAEYAIPTPSPGFEAIFARRMAANTLLPLTSLTSAPGRPEDALLMYGQSRSVVAYMLDVHGEEALRELLRRLGEGDPIDAALTTAYGVDRVGLEQAWRASIGAPPLEATPSRSSLPTPLPRPALTPFGAGATPFPTTTTPGPGPSPGEAPAATRAAPAQASGGCARGQDGIDLAAAAPALLLSLVWRCKRQ